MQNSDPKGQNFLSAPDTHIWFFFLHTFRFWMFYFKSSIHYHTPWRWSRTFFKLDVIVTLQWRQPNDKVAWCLILLVQTKFTWQCSFLGEITLVEIRISIQSETLGFPYLICKNIIYHTIVHPKDLEEKKNALMFKFLIGFTKLFSLHLDQMRNSLSPRFLSQNNHCCWELMLNCSSHNVVLMLNYCCLMFGWCC